MSFITSNSSFNMVSQNCIIQAQFALNFKNLRNVLMASSKPQNYSNYHLSNIISSYVDDSICLMNILSQNEMISTDFKKMTFLFSNLETSLSLEEDTIIKEEGTLHLSSINKQRYKGVGTIIERILELKTRRKCFSFVILFFYFLSKTPQSLWQNKACHYLYNTIFDFLKSNLGKNNSIKRHLQLIYLLNQMAFQQAVNKINSENDLYLSELRKLSIVHKIYPKTVAKENLLNESINTNSFKGFEQHDEDKDLECHEDVSTASESSRDIENKQEIELWSSSVMNLGDLIQKQFEDQAGISDDDERKACLSHNLQNALNSYQGFFIGNLEITFDPSDSFLSLPMKPLPKKKNVTKRASAMIKTQINHQFFPCNNQSFSPPYHRMKSIKKEMLPSFSFPPHSPQFRKKGKHTYQNQTDRIISSQIQTQTPIKKKLNYNVDKSDGIPMSAFIDQTLKELNSSNKSNKKKEERPQKDKTTMEASKKNFSPNLKKNERSEFKGRI